MYGFFFNIFFSSQYKDTHLLSTQKDKTPAMGFSVKKEKNSLNCCWTIRSSLQVNIGDVYVNEHTHTNWPDFDLSCASFPLFYAKNSHQNCWGKLCKTMQLNGSADQPLKIMLKNSKLLNHSNSIWATIYMYAHVNFRLFTARVSKGTSTQHLFIFTL